MSPAEAPAQSAPGAPPPPASGPPAAAEPSTVAPRATATRWPRLRRVVRFWFPPTPAAPRRSDGLTSNPGPDRAALLVAILIATIAAAAFEKFAWISPIPPGGDEGTWLLLSYPYIGLPSPSQTPLLGYPPASFPLLALSVVAGGGPLLGARIFSAGLVFGLGLSFYALGRSMFRMRFVALAMEAAFYAQPDFQQLYYFGSYPNMFGFIFFFLTLAFALRFLRSRRPAHLAMFWAMAAIAVLSHALVGVFLIGLLAVAVLLLLLYQRVPRELLSKVGLLGAAAFVVSTASYYVGATVLGFSAPNYLATGPLTTAKSTLALPTVLKPLYLEPLAGIFRGGGFSMSTPLALQIVWEIVGAIVGLVLFLRLVAPRGMTHRWTIVASWFLSVLLVALGTWYVGLTADYRRFAYFLYPPTLLVLGIFLDAGLFTTAGLGAAIRRQLPDAPTPGAPPGRRRRPRRLGRLNRYDATSLALGAIVVAVLAVSVDVYTVPTAQGFASYFSQNGHDQGLVDAMKALAGSGIPGSIISVTPVVDRWPSTLSARNLYEVRPPTGYTYTAANLVQDELAYLATNDRYAVTNGLALGLLPGVSPSYFNASPIYAFYLFGVPRPVFQVSPQNIFVTLVGQPERPVYVHNSTLLPQMVRPSDPSNGSFVLWFNGSGYAVSETVTAPPGGSSLSIAFQATATGPANLTRLRVKMSPATGNYDLLSNPSAGVYSWFTNTSAGNFSTAGSVAPADALTSVVPGNATTGRGASLMMGVNNTSAVGTANLSFRTSASTAGASNTASGVSGFYSATALWTMWSARFVLLWSGTNQTGPVAQAYFTNEYGATVFFQNTLWTVLLLPSQPLYS